ncbi:hypothetical protein BDZ91DRAFT_260883 [Kalaharituber pfeilii]|nr:hypothetical protein BDZ91DRAFT_260883 [Kalaharituber pfeilii]
MHEEREQPKMTTPAAPKGLNPAPPPTPSKRQSILDTLLNFGKPTYVPLTPIEILPGIMSTDGVAKVFQLDTRKPRTQRQAAKRAAQKAANHRKEGQQQWEHAPNTGGYFDTSGNWAERKTKNHLGDEETGSHKSKGFRNGFKIKDFNQNGPHVRHANPFTGLLSRNQTELNIPKYSDGPSSKGRSILKAKMSGGLPPSPPYPHQRLPAVSTPNLNAIPVLEGLIPMPSVHEPSPFSFPGATAEEIDAYERAREAAAADVAQNLSVPCYRKVPTMHHLSENEKGVVSSKRESFLVLDGGQEQQLGQEHRKHKRRHIGARSSSLQDRHLQTPLRKATTVTWPPYPLSISDLAPLQHQTTPDVKEKGSRRPLQSASNKDHRQSKAREQPISTSTSTMRGEGAIPMGLSDGMDKKTRVFPTKKKPLVAKEANIATSVAANTVIPNHNLTRIDYGGERRQSNSGQQDLMFLEKMPIINPRQLAEYRRARAGLPPLTDKEGIPLLRARSHQNLNLPELDSTDSDITEYDAGYTEA